MRDSARTTCLLLIAVVAAGAWQPVVGQEAQTATACVVVGDVVQVTIFERVAHSERETPDNFATLPAETAGPEGTFPVPHAGEIGAGGRSIAEIEREIAKRLASLATVTGVIVKRLERNPAGRCPDGVERR